MPSFDEMSDDFLRLSSEVVWPPLRRSTRAAGPGLGYQRYWRY